jgi:hypothetical protein
MARWKRRRFSQLAEETKMTSPEFISYKLNIGDIHLRFDVDVAYSIEDSVNYFNAEYPEEVFARGSMNLEFDGANFLILDCIDNGNLVESLKRLEKLILLPPKIDDLENEVAIGKLSEWHASYWQLAENDALNPRVEGIFDRLKIAMGNSGADGAWYAYQYFDQAMFEVTLFSKPSVEEKTLYVSSQFEPDETSLNVKNIRLMMRSDLYSRIKKIS